VDQLCELLGQSELSALEELQVSYVLDESQKLMASLNARLDDADAIYAASQNRLAGIGKSLQQGMVESAQTAKASQRSVRNTGSTKRRPEEDIVPDGPCGKRKTGKETDNDSLNDDVATAQEVDEARRLVAEEVRASLSSLADSYASDSED